MVQVRFPLCEFDCKQAGYCLLLSFTVAVAIATGQSRIEVA